GMGRNAELDGAVTRARLGLARRLARYAAISMAAPFPLFLVFALAETEIWKHLPALAIPFAIAWGGAAPFFAIAAALVARDEPLGRLRVVIDRAGVSFSSVDAGGWEATYLSSATIAGAMVVRGLCQACLELTADTGEVFRVELPSEDAGDGALELLGFGA